MSYVRAESKVMMRDQEESIDGTAWTPLRRLTVSDEIVDRLISSILGGRFQFGESFRQSAILPSTSMWDGPRCVRLFAP